MKQEDICLSFYAFVYAHNTNICANMQDRKLKQITGKTPETKNV